MSLWEEKSLRRGVCFTASIKILAWKKLNFTQIIIIKSLTLFCGLELTWFGFCHTHCSSLSHTHTLTHTYTHLHTHAKKPSTQKDHKFKANHYHLSEMCGNCWYENSWRKCKRLFTFWVLSYLFALLSFFFFFHISFSLCFSLHSLCAHLHSFFFLAESFPFTIYGWYPEKPFSLFLFFLNLSRMKEKTCARCSFNWLLFSQDLTQG